MEQNKFQENDWSDFYQPSQEMNTEKNYITK